MPGINEAYVGEVDGDGVGRLWYSDDAGVRQAVPHVIVDSPPGLAWGFAGNGPADTARSILAAEIGDTAAAEQYYRAFTIDVVSGLPLNQRFALARSDVQSWLAANGYERASAPQRLRSPAEGALGGDEPAAGEADREAAQLAARSRALDERERQVTEREARVDALAVAAGLIPDVPQATSLPAEPVRHQLEALVIDSGDDIAEVARANNLDPDWAASVVNGNTTRVELARVRQVCAGLACTPYDMWGTDAARSVAGTYGPAEWPAVTEPLMPVDGVDVPVGADHPGRVAVSWPAPQPASAAELGPELTLEPTP